MPGPKLGQILLSWLSCRKANLGHASGQVGPHRPRPLRSAVVESVDASYHVRFISRFPKSGLDPYGVVAFGRSITIPAVTTVAVPRFFDVRTKSKLVQYALSIDDNFPTNLADEFALFPGRQRLRVATKDSLTHLSLKWELIGLQASYRTYLILAAPTTRGQSI